MSWFKRRDGESDEDYAKRVNAEVLDRRSRRERNRQRRLAERARMMREVIDRG